MTAANSNQPILKPRDHWRIEDLPWHLLDPSKVDADVLKVAKAASMVEYNAQDYGKYLCGVFHDDPEFQATVNNWVSEEVQHGKVLGLWCERVDPTFNHEKSFKMYREKIVINTDVKKSIRGSRVGEMVARCMVETGTSSYYSALGEATQEPVLKIICEKIAGDEFRHYKTFYDNLKRYLDKEKLNKFQRLMVAVGRVAETEDDELAFAYYAANDGVGEYDRKTYNREYSRRAYSYYQPQHIERGLAMLFKASGLKPHTPAFKLATKTACWYFGKRAQSKAAA
jgi:rubrerythrin